MLPMRTRFAWPYAAIVFVYCVVIFFLSSGPVPEEVEELSPFSGFDKVVHGVLFGGLAACVAVGLWRSNARLTRRQFIGIPVLFTTLYGVSDELHQYFVPERSVEFWDLIADFLGALIVTVGLVEFVFPRLPFRGATCETGEPPPPNTV